MSDKSTTVSPTPEAGPIRTPDQRLRVFVSSTLRELAPERGAVRDAVERLRLAPVMFEMGARPHPPRQLYRAYLAQSQVFVGVYWQSYGWVAPDEEVSGLEDEYRLSNGLPKLIYVKSPAPEREPRLGEMLSRIRDDDGVSYKRFSSPEELGRLVEDDLALLLTERFEATLSREDAPDESRARALPVPPTPLVDREKEVEAAEELLRPDGARLVTLTGAGGIGKSRLALEVAARLAPGFEDGARFVELAPVSSPGLVAASISRALGLRESGNQTPAEDLKSFLRERELLLAERVAKSVHRLFAGALLALLTTLSLGDLQVLHHPAQLVEKFLRVGAQRGPLACREFAPVGQPPHQCGIATAGAERLAVDVDVATVVEHARAPVQPGDRAFQQRSGLGRDGFVGPDGTGRCQPGGVRRVDGGDLLDGEEQLRQHHRSRPRRRAMAARRARRPGRHPEDARRTPRSRTRRAGNRCPD